MFYHFSFLFLFSFVTVGVIDFGARLAVELTYRRIIYTGEGGQDFTITRKIRVPGKLWRNTRGVIFVG